MGDGDGKAGTEQPVTLDAWIERLRHDLRIPISNILGYADLVRQQAPAPLSVDQESFLRRIEENCQSVLSQIEQFASEADQLNRKESATE